MSTKPREKRGGVARAEAWSGRLRRGWNAVVTSAGKGPGGSVAAAVLFLAPLALVFDLAGCLPLHLRVLLLTVLLAAPLALWPGRRGWLGLAALVGALALQALWAPPPVAFMALWLLVHLAVWEAVGAAPGRLTLGIAAYAALHVFLFLSPTGYGVAEALAAGMCQVAGWLTGSSYHLGPTFVGLGGALLFLCLSIAGWDGSRLGFWRTAAQAVVTLLAGSVLALVLIRKVDFGADMVWELKYTEPFGWRELWQHVKGLALLGYPALIFAVQMTIYLVLHHQRKPAVAGAGAVSGAGGAWLGLKGLDPRWSSAVALPALAGLWLWAPPTAWRHPGPLKMVFVEKGVVSFTKPDYTRYGRAAGGMYGLFPEYARLFGCETEIVRDLPDELKGDEVLVLTNVDFPLTAEQRERLWNFVRNGGRLWVLGDHTFIKNGRNHINDLLEPCHIRLNHDSAQFFPQGWFNSYDFRQGTPFGELRDHPPENRPAILVGASLRLETPATPLVLGRYGYGDWGTTASDEQRGYIGDFRYQAEERLGDLVLVAGERVGQGRVLVFGDTTSFFCNNMPRSYEIMRAAISWLSEAPLWDAGHGAAGRWMAGLLAIGLAAGLLAAGRRRAVVWWLGLATVYAWWGHRPTGQVPWDTAYSRTRLAIVDFSHQPEASRHSSMDNGLHGLTINLMRYGLLPIAADAWDRELLDQARLLVMTAPQRVIDRAEQRDLEAFIERGGTFWLACGFPHYRFARQFLEDHGLRVRGLPLGRFFDREMFGHRVSFFSAWPLETTNPRLAVICTYDNWPLVGVLPMGQGRMAVIGDSEMLQNRNVEGFETYDPASIQFIRSLLDYTVGPPGS